MNQRLHEWFYQIIYSVCFDRDYLYLLFVKHFSTLMMGIFENGKYMEQGFHSFMGIKSGLRVDLEWRVNHRINYVGLNIVTLHCRIIDVGTDLVIEDHTGTFEISSGELLPGVAAGS